MKRLVKCFIKIKDAKIMLARYVLYDFSLCCVVYNCDGD